jgi:hypothetical protein
MDEVVALVAESLTAEWSDAYGLVLWDHEEQQYAFPVRETDDILWDENLGALGDAFWDIVNAIDTKDWCPRSFPSLSRSEVLMGSWNRLVQTVKHKRRFFFGFAPRLAQASEYFDPLDLLKQIGRFAERFAVLRTVPPSTRFFRAQAHSATQVLVGCGRLGTAPSELALQSNRMSPAGIPMFYGATDTQTAVREVFDDTRVRPVVTVATFATTKPLVVLDLTAVPNVPSIFDEVRRHQRGPIEFLRSFAREIAKPIARDEREHIEYVPSQVVTEYFRDLYETRKGDKVSGILYSSVKRKGGVCCVLFASNEECGGDADAWLNANLWLKLANTRRFEDPARILK